MKVSAKILAIIEIPTFLPKFFYRMANTVTIDSHPETTFGGSYRKARMLVSDETRIRIGRYGSPYLPIRADKHHPGVGRGRYAMTGGVFTIYFIYSICTDSAVDNHVDNLCITACITYADIHTIGVRRAQGGISTEKLDSFQQVFHTFIWSKDINLLTLQDIRRWCITTFTVVIQPINIRHRCV